MLVNNPCISDGRVIKSAEAMAHIGYKVTVLCRHQEGLLKEEVRNEVRYKRIPKFEYGVRYLVSVLLNNYKSIVHLMAPKFFLQDVVLYLVRVFVLFFGLFLIPLFFLFKLNLALMCKVERYIILNVKKIRNFICELFYIDEFVESVKLSNENILADIVHAHDLNSLPLGLKIAQKNNAKLIYDSHELEMSRNSKYSWLARRCRKQKEKIGIQKSDCTITVSDSIGTHLQHSYKLSNVNIIYNAPEVYCDNSLKRDIRSDLKLTNDVPLIIFVGNVTINRGVDKVLDAIAKEPSLHFAMIGARRVEVEIALRGKIKALNLLNRVYFVEPVLPHEVVSYINTADVSVLPIQNACLSYYYCMPNKLFESVFAGLPVAVSNLFDMSKFVLNYNCGLVMDEKSPDDILRVIRKILRNRTDYLLDEEKYNELIAKYSWQTQAGNLKKIYEDLFAENV